MALLTQVTVASSYVSAVLPAMLILGLDDLFVRPAEREVKP